MKDIKNYEGLYAITSCGKVWSYRNKKFLKTYTNDDGYLLTTLWKKGRGKTHKVHRLVAEAYIPNPDNLPQVNHRDENKTNNCLQNLEWCDSKYNTNYGTCITKRSNSCKKPILQYDLGGNFIREWSSATDVGRKAKGNICNCLKGKLPSAYGFKWVYKD